MPRTREQIFKKIMAQAVLRGLEPEQRGDIIFVHYPEPQPTKADNLHKQSIRSLVKKEGGEDWKIHIASMGQEGFSVEIRPTPSVETVPAAEPGPVVLNQDIDLDDAEKLKKLAEQLGSLARELEALAS